MELFKDVIGGPYTILLIFQVLIVSGLAMALVWMLVERVREVLAAEAPSERAQDEQSFLGQSAPVGKGAALGSESGVDSQENLGALSAPVEEAEVAAPEAEPEIGFGSDTVQDPIEIQPASPVSMKAEVPELSAPLVDDAESAALKDKVRYLESRLMEYEIVQEEISNLSQLRGENEQLRKELQRLRTPGSEAPKTKPPVQAQESGLSPEPALGPEAVPEEGPASEANPLLDKVSRGQVDDILRQLDEITASKS